jgi:hypothetical protein
MPGPVSGQEAGMRGALVSSIRTGLALATGLAGAAAARAQVPAVSIDDVWVVEGSGGPWEQTVTVKLSEPAPQAFDVPWKTIDGSATAGQDYGNRTGTVSFGVGSDTAVLSVSIIGDTLATEWSPTVPRDEAFFIDLQTPSPAGAATLLKSRATVTIIDDDRTLPGLQFVSAVADGSASGGRARLQWRVPASSASGAPNDVLVRWNVDTGSGCSAPASATGGMVAGEFRVWADRSIAVKPPGTTQVVDHTGLPFVKHCYALFAVYSGVFTTERAVVSATPFDATAPNPVAWTYSAGGDSPSVEPPTVGESAIYTVSTDGVVHAMTRGQTGGLWPTGWNPVGLGKPAHNRSPVVPLPYGQRLFVGTELGEVHAVDGEDGAIAWSRSAAFQNTQLPHGAGVMGTPAGLFTSWGGQNDAILVGSDLTSSNSFYALDPETGDVLSTFSNSAMGAVRGMPVVDYTINTNRVYFVTALGSAGALWAFELGTGFPPLGLTALPGGNPAAPSYGSNGSPVLRNARLYYGNTNREVVAYRPASGQTRSMGGLDGEVKGFLFPDRRNNYFYFSTPSSVWGVTDTGSPDPMLSLKWVVGDITTPSTVLHWPGTNHLYVGSGDGKLYQLDVSLPSPQTLEKFVPLESNAIIGAPSLDGPNGLVLVGSDTGVIYAVRVPLP